MRDEVTQVVLRITLPDMNRMIDLPESVSACRCGIPVIDPARPPSQQLFLEFCRDGSRSN